MVEPETSESGRGTSFFTIVIKNKILMFSYDQDEPGG